MPSCSCWWLKRARPRAGMESASGEETPAAEEEDEAARALLEPVSSGGGACRLGEARATNGPWPMLLWICQSCWGWLPRQRPRPTQLEMLQKSRYSCVGKR